MSISKLVCRQRIAQLGALVILAALAAALMASPASAGHKSKHNPGGENSTTYDVSLEGHPEGDPDPNGVADPIVTGSCLSCADSLHFFVQLRKELDDFCLASPSHPLEGDPLGCGSGEVLITEAAVGLRERHDQLVGLQVWFRRGHGDKTRFNAQIELSPVAVPDVGKSFPIHVDKNDIDVFEGSGPIKNKTPVGTISIGDIVFTPS